LILGGFMCDGFSEAFLAASAVGSADFGAGAAATAIGASEASTMGVVGANLGALGSTVGWGGALAAGSAVMSGVSSGMQANAQQQAQQYQAQVASNNAKLAGEQASSTVQAGQAAAMQSGLQAAQVLGEQKAALAANGVNLGSGSAIDLQATTHYLNAQDISNITNNAARQAWGYNVDSSNYAAQSGLSAWQGHSSNPAAIGTMGGASSLLGSASLYAMGNKTNLFGAMVG
jgi:hypothetical protein